MNLEEIKAALERGDYNIQVEDDCGCAFFWHIDDFDALTDGCDCCDCWVAKVLYVGDEAIAQHVRYEDREVLIDGLDEDDIPQEVWDALSWPLGESWSSGSGPSHDKHRRDALIDWLMEGNYELDRDYERGFGNEYTMILRELPSGKTTKIDRADAEGWADDYLYAGDAATESYVAFRLEQRS